MIFSAIIHTWFTHPSQHPEQHHDRFSRFCMAHGRDRQTDRHTDHASPSV